MNYKIEKVFNTGKTIPIVFATDKGFIPYMYVALTSLIENSSLENNYDIVILYTDVDEYNLNRIAKLSKSNISIRFFDMSTIMNNYVNTWYTCKAYTEAVYYRFIIPQLFANYNKILYLDGDIIVNCDIAELYDVDLEDNWVAASIEPSVSHVKSPAYKYIPSVLKLKNEEYFNSGIMIFDVEKLSKMDFFGMCVEKLKEIKTPKFPDQDVLNIVCLGHVKRLDISYNLMWNIINYYDNIWKYMTKESYEEFQNALKNPKILHYCGGYKPWKKPSLPYSEYFWIYARKTSFYEQLLYSNLQVDIKNVIYRRKTYCKYLIYKLLSKVTFGKLKNKYNEKIVKSKTAIQCYRKALR